MHVEVIAGPDLQQTETSACGDRSCIPLWPSGANEILQMEIADWQQRFRVDNFWMSWWAGKHWHISWASWPVAGSPRYCCYSPGCASTSSSSCLLRNLRRFLVVDKDKNSLLVLGKEQSATELL